MKKLLLCLFVYLAFNGFLSAQSNVDLSFKFWVERNGTPIPDRDTVTEGETVTLRGIINNDGTEDFNGDISLQFAAARIADFPTTATPHPFDVLQGLSIPAGGAANMSKPFTFKGSDFVLDSFNIVIIWPSESIQDLDTTNNYGTFRVFVKKVQLASGIEEQTLNSTLSIYPNPAAQTLNVVLNDAGAGTLSLSDISGRKLYSMPVRNGATTVQIPLEGSMSAGMYFVTLSTDRYQEVRKIQVAK